MSVRLQAKAESFPLKGVFRISRGAKTQSDVVTVTAERGGMVGRGECVPYPRYEETPESVLAQIQALAEAPQPLHSRQELQSRMPPGAARNAVDCALWDLEAKEKGQPVWQLAGLAPPQTVTTAFTISLDQPEAMFTAAQQAAHRPMLKLKLAGDERDLPRVRAVREAAPAADLIVDANEACDAGTLATFCLQMHELQVKMIEQPLPAGADDALESFKSPVPLCADESCHDRGSLQKLLNKYQFINIKLDKTGGLTEAIALKDAAEKAGFQIMVGCMVGTSLSMAPALFLASTATIADLDGPLYLTRDRDPGLCYRESVIEPPGRELWG